jgi:hypothetical protein
VTVAGAKAVAWIVTHLEKVQQVVDLVSGGFKTASGLRILDFDSLAVDGESLPQALGEDPILIRAVLEVTMRTHGFDAVWSEKKKSDMY